MDNQNENKQSTPFSARINPIYEYKFNELLDTYKDHEGNLPRGAKKELLERMISRYVNEEEKKNKEEAFALESEINLIAGNLNNILAIFKNIRTKAQDTIITERETSKQAIENLNKKLELTMAQLEDLNNKCIVLEGTNNSFEELRQKLSTELSEVKKALDMEKTNNADLEKEIKSYKNIEKLNISLENESVRLKEEISILKNTIIEKDSKIKALEDKVKDTNDEVSEIRAKKDSEMAELDKRKSKEILELQNKIKSSIHEIEDRAKREAEIDIKQTKLNADMKINDMQLKLIEITKELNDKNTEIENLNSKLKKLESQNKSV